ncbi:hypothetical protein MJK72_10385 [Klebsiella pneumoniae]|nr:hypothetical protein MJK72_10385 [Klebsiella pneumoniae]
MVSIVVVGDAAKRMVLARIFAPSAPIPLMMYPGKDFWRRRPARYQQALKYDDLLAIQKQPWVRSATPAVSKSLRAARQQY